MGASRKQIDDFFLSKSIVLVGVSRNPKDLTRGLFKELKQRGYNVFPVNPNTQEIDDETCFPSVDSINKDIDAAIIFTPTATLHSIIDSLLKKNVKNIWIYNNDNKGEAIKSLAEEVEKKGVSIIYGYCPYMFISNTQFFHRAHGFFAKLFGNYPSQNSSI